MASDNNELFYAAKIFKVNGPNSPYIGFLIHLRIYFWYELTNILG